jgi:hypothetical protein
MTSTHACPLREGEETPCTIRFGSIQNKGHVLIEAIISNVTKETNENNEEIKKINERKMESRRSDRSQAKYGFRVLLNIFPLRLFRAHLVMTSDTGLSGNTR